jgi:hypothetical protein
MQGWIGSSNLGGIFFQGAPKKKVAEKNNADQRVIRGLEPLSGTRISSEMLKRKNDHDGGGPRLPKGPPN